MSRLDLKQARAAVFTLRSHLARRATTQDTLGQELRAVLANLDEVSLTDGWLETQAHPVIERLADGLPSREGQVADALEAFQALFPTLPWRYGYTPRPELPGLEDRMAWAELVGPLAPFHSDKVCLGITAIGPHTRYPEHLHPAIEVYFVLSGTARWTAEGVSHERPPGRFILHPSNIVHVMETGDEPLIAAYTWRGDIVSPSIYTDSSQP